MADLGAIHEVVERAKRRVRIQAALDGAVTATILAAATACAAIFALRVDLLPAIAGVIGLAAAGAIIVAGAIAGAVRRIDDETLARRIDRASGLSDRLSTAIAFDREPTDDGFVQLAIADGVRAAPQARVEDATPYRKPRDLRAAAAFVIASALIAGLAVPAIDRPVLARLPAASIEPPPDNRPAWDVEYAESLVGDLRTLATKDGDRRLRKLADELEAHLGRLARNEIDKLQLLEAFEAAAHTTIDGDDLSAVAGGQIDDIREAIRRLEPRGPGVQPTDPIALEEPPPGPPPPPTPPPGPTGPNPTAPPPDPTTTPPPGTPPPGTPDPDKPGWDDTRDRKLTGPPTTPVDDTKDVALPGKPNAQPSRRTAIKAAATHGFAQAPYKKVYLEYRGQNEEVMRNEKLPASYRYYIKRYFFRIKPS